MSATSEDGSGVSLGSCTQVLKRWVCSFAGHQPSSQGEEMLAVTRQTCQYEIYLLTWKWKCYFNNPASTGVEVVEKLIAG